MQITLLYLLGVIGEWAFKDLRNVAKIRNDFAHKYASTHGKSVSQVTFESPSIKDRCRLLASPETFVKATENKNAFGCDLTTPRDRFLLTVLGMMHGLNGTITRLESPSDNRA